MGLCLTRGVNGSRFGRYTAFGIGIGATQEYLRNHQLPVSKLYQSRLLKRLDAGADLAKKAKAALAAGETTVAAAHVRTMDELKPKVLKALSKRPSESSFNQLNHLLNDGQKPDETVSIVDGYSPLYPWAKSE